MSDWPQEIKKTRARQSVLSALEQSERPLSAQEICARLDTNGRNAWLSTVYRALELFVQKGMAVKRMLPDGTALYEPKTAGHRHYAVCMRCSRLIPMQQCPLEHFSPALEDGSFVVMGHSLEVFGLCSKCAVTMHK